MRGPGQPIASASASASAWAWRRDPACARVRVRTTHEPAGSSAAGGRHVVEQRAARASPSPRDAGRRRCAGARRRNRSPRTRRRAARRAAAPRRRGPAPERGRRLDGAERVGRELRRRRELPDATRSRRPSSRSAAAVAPCRGTRRRRRPAPRTPPGARRRRPAGSRARPGAPRGRRAASSRPVSSVTGTTVPRVGITPCIAASTGATRTNGPSARREAPDRVLPGAPRSRATARSLRTGSASQAGSRATRPAPPSATRSNAIASSASRGPAAGREVGASSADARAAMAAASPASARATIGRSRASRSARTAPRRRRCCSSRDPFLHPIPEASRRVVPRTPRTAPFASRRGIWGTGVGSQWLGPASAARVSGRGTRRRRRTTPPARPPARPPDVSPVAAKS